MLKQEENFHSQISFEYGRAANDGQKTIQVKINIPCSALEYKQDRYLCTIWDSQNKPVICSRFPSSAFFRGDETTIFSTDPEKIERIRAAQEERCPALKNVTAEQIIKGPLLTES